MLNGVNDELGIEWFRPDHFRARWNKDRTTLLEVGIWGRIVKSDGSVGNKLLDYCWKTAAVDGGVDLAEVHPAIADVIRQYEVDNDSLSADWTDGGDLAETEISGLGKPAVEGSAVRAWSFLAVDDSERNYQGNAGYDDVLGKRYTWDAKVPNSGGVSKGDLVILRDSKYVLGVAWIDTIDRWTATKERYRCPGCGNTKLRLRKKSATKYRCGVCKAEFDDRAVEMLDNLEFYRADYERTWQPLDIAMPKEILEPAFKSGAKQNALRELDLLQARKIIEQSQPLGAVWWASRCEGDKKQLPGGHYAVVGKARIGQQRFREEMLNRFSGSCAISGPLPGAMLDAAHVYRYADKGEHYIDGGLLLRRDLHALFDRCELLIDPDDGWRVWIHPEHAIYPELWRFNGNVILAKESARPDPDFLRIHAAIARDKWENIGAAD